MPPSSFESLSSSEARGGSDSGDGGGPCDFTSCLFNCCSAASSSSGETIVSRRSMGPLADSLGVTTGVAMWLAVVQLPLMMGMVLHYPTVRVDLFTTSIRTVPVTLMTPGPANFSHPPSAAQIPQPSPSSTAAESAIAAADASAVWVSSYDHGISISGVYVLSAASVTFFAVLCMNLIDRSMAHSGGGGGDDYEAAYSIRARVSMGSRMLYEEFVAQNLGMMIDPTFRMWNQAFSLMVLATHGTIAVTVCSPVQWLGIGLYLLLLNESLVALAQPLDNFTCRSARAFLAAAAEDDESSSMMMSGSGGAQAAPGMMASISSQRVMVRMALGSLSVLYLLNNIPVDRGAYKTQLLLLLGCIDAFMLYGHMWDKVPNLHAVLNCRFLYACFLAVVNALAFVTWAPYLSTPFAV